ncbi:MAG: hypothetical protein U0610_20395 [bacterium]
MISCASRLERVHGVEAKIVHDQEIHTDEPAQLGLVLKSRRASFSVLSILSVRTARTETPTGNVTECVREALQQTPSGMRSSRRVLGLARRGCSWPSLLEMPQQRWLR